MMAVTISRSDTRLPTSRPLPRIKEYNYSKCFGSARAPVSDVHCVALGSGGAARVDTYRLISGSRPTVCLALMSRED